MLSVWAEYRRQCLYQYGARRL